MTTTSPKPCLKWVGGKTQILNDVFALFPTSIESYHEPFVGGGSVLIEFLNRVRAGTIQLTGSVYASDLNPHLIAMYKVIQSNPDGLINALRILTAAFTAAAAGTTVNRKPTTQEEAATSQESYYYWIRSQFILDHSLTPVQRAAMFIFLNKTCFRGVYREGPRGFNVPFGHYKNPGVYDEPAIRSLSALIANVIFTHAPFTQSMTLAKKGDFMYLDPPYAPVDSKSFTGYTAAGFDADAHSSLFKAVAALRPAGVSALMSNADVELVKKAFPSPSYTTIVINCKRSIHSKDPAHRVNEVLISN